MTILHSSLSARLLLAALATAPLVAVACSSSSSGGNATNTDADGGNKADTSSVVPGGGVVQSGRIVDLSAQGTGVGGASIQIGGQTITADAKGNYTVTLPVNTPVSMVVTAPNYYKLLEGEWQLSASASRGSTRLPSVDTATGLLAALSLAGTLDTSKGVLSVVAIPQTGCASEVGATFDVSPKDASTRGVYLKGALPDTSLNSAVAGESPHIVFFNVPVGQPVTVTVTSPTCSQLAFPQNDADGFTYTGKVNMEADNQTLSFFRVFLGPHMNTDAGTSADAGTSSDAADQ
jgi:hypothetical protein